MNGGRCSTTRIWRPPSSTASWSADGSFASMDPRDELVISSSRTPCQAVPNGSEYLEYVAQNFRNPQGRGRFLQLLDMPLPPCCPYHPAGVTCRIGQPAPCHAAFAPT